MRATSTVLLLLACFATSGCLAAAVGGAAALGAYKYAENEAFRDYRTDLQTAWRATVDAMREQGYPVVPNAPHGPTEGAIAAGDAAVRVERHAEGFTRVRVRIGTFETDDHRRRADLILAAVSRLLGAA